MFRGHYAFIITSRRTITQGKWFCKYFFLIFLTFPRRPPILGKKCFREAVSMLFDTHAHYDNVRFDSDREELLRSLPANYEG